jgi:hypothetical protein
LRGGLKPVVVPIAANLVVAVLRSLVVDHLRLNLVLENRNDLPTIITLIFLTNFIVWGGLLLVNLNDLLLLLHGGI